MTSSRERRALVVIAVAAGVLAPLAGSPYLERRAGIDVAELAAVVAREQDHVTAVDLAGWIKDRKPGLRVIDVRPAEDFNSYHLPSAESVPLESLPTSRFQPTDTLVLYSEGGAHAAQAWVFLEALGYRRVYFLRGGLDEWQDEVMNPTLEKNASPERVSAFERVAALSRYFGGVPRTGDATASHDADGRPSSAAATQAASRPRRAVRRMGC